MTKLPTKRRVESCLTIGPPRGPLRDIKGFWFWDRFLAFVEYRVFVTSQELHLAFQCDGGQTQHQHIQLVSSKPHYGGVRWWFLCLRCDRRVSRLHLPARGGFDFLCRYCHNLTYESVQASRSKSEKFFKIIARDLESTTREALQWFRVMRGGVVHEVKRPTMDKVRDRRVGIALEVTKLAREKGLSL